jgi:hypothetical protein
MGWWFNQPLVITLNSDSNFYLQIRLPNDRKLAFGCSADGEWHFLVAAYNAGSVALYTDGVLALSGSGGPATSTSSDPFSIGNLFGSSASTWGYGGLVAEPFIHAAAWSDSDAAAQFRASQQRFIDLNAQRRLTS